MAICLIVHHYQLLIFKYKLYQKCNKLKQFIFSEIFKLKFLIFINPLTDYSAVGTRIFIYEDQ